jgi:general secretion pathway protein M
MRRGSLPSRLLALTLVLLAGLALVRLLVLPVLAAWQETAASIEQSQTLLQRYRALAAQRPQLERELGNQRRAEIANVAYLQGESDALASAALQDQVRAIITRAGGELRSTQILPVEPAGPETSVRRASLRLQLAVDVEGLQQLLYELETSEPYLFVEDLNIREQRLRRLRDEEEEAPILDVSLEVSGYMRAAGDGAVG